jgi:CRISPR-associated endonuclease Cas1/group II intron reverse transcriptase/maturase
MGRTGKRKSPQPVAERPAGRLWTALINPDGLDSAWRRIRANYPASNLPAEIVGFAKEAPKRLKALARELERREFIPLPAALIEIPKPNKPGETRRIALARIEDRIVLSRLHQLLTPIFDHRFPERSYAYRPRRGARQAIDRVSACLSQGLVHTAAADIDDFFPSIRRDLLMTQLRRYLYEKPLLDLLETYLHMGSERHSRWEDTGLGIAQGSPISPLLSNLYLLEFDQRLDQQGVEWIRYADNVLVLGAEAEPCRTALERAGVYLEQTLGLRWNETSIEVKSEEAGFEFLGYWFEKGQRRMSDDRLSTKRKAVEARIRGFRGSVGGMVRMVSEMSRGWRAYYQGEAVRPQLEALEELLAVEVGAWLRGHRDGQSGRSGQKALERQLREIELPASLEAAARRRWIRRVLLRVRLKDARPKPRPEGPQRDAARQAVEQRKRELARRRVEMEEILITQPGTSLHRNGERLVVRREGKRQAEVPLSLIRGISLMTTAVSLSADLMAETATRGIRLTIHGRDGRAMVRSGPPEAPDFAISELQTRLAGGGQAHRLARQFVAGKIRNQINLLKYLNKHKGRRNAAEVRDAVGEAVETMEPLWRSVRVFEPAVGGPPAAQSLFALEGQAAAAYWQALRVVLPPDAGFSGRVRRGANDLVNSLLNYGYAILYSRLQDVLVKAGLNPQIGFLHTPREGKMALLYDFIEEFRPPVVDRVVVTLLNQNKAYLEEGEGLPVPVRQELARGVIQRWRKEDRYAGGKATIEQIAAAQAERLIRHLRGAEVYEPYVFTW